MTRPYHGHVKRRTWWIISAGAAAAILLLLGLVASSRAKDFQAAALQGKQEASAAVASLTAKDPAAAVAQFDAATTSFGTAKDLLGPEWATGAIRVVPWLGAQVGAADDLATIGLHGSSAGKEIASMLAATPTASDGQTGLGALLKTARPQLDAALVSLTTVADRYLGLSDQGLVAPLAEAVREAKQVLGPMDSVLQRSHSMLALERFFLATPRRILVVSQNNAELRPTGGFIGSYGLLNVGPDGFSLEEYQDIYSLKDSHLIPSPAAATMAQKYLQLRDAGWWIDYPTSARTMLRLWQDLDQPPIDGIVAVDVVAMRDLLRIFGPISVDEFDATFTADNLLERLIEIVEIQMGPTGEPRKGVLVRLANELTRRMMDMKAEDLLETSQALGKSANEKHVQLFFTDAQTQAMVDEAGWAGAIDPPEGTTDLLAVTNAMIRASKSNMAVRKSIDYRVALAADGSADTTLVLGYSNTDPLLNGILRRWFGNYLRVYRPLGTELVADSTAAPETSMVTDEIGLPAVTRAFRLYRGNLVQQVIRTTVPHALVEGRAAVVPRSPVALGAAPPTAPADQVAHYRLLIVRQADLDNVPTTVSVTLPSGRSVGSVSAWKRTTGEALPVTTQGDKVTLSTPLDGDVILDVETTSS